MPLEDAWINIHKYCNRNIVLCTTAYTTRRIANTYRSCVSICGQPCNNFPHICFDHHAKFGCHFSYCVRACKRFQNNGDTGAPSPRDGVWLTPRNKLLPQVIIPNFEPLCQTVWAHIRGSQIILETLGPSPMDGDMVGP